jgi:ABC-type polysaccharide/polyol phosphate transport system ATPase subunit
MNPVVTVENVSKRYVFRSYRPSLRHEFGDIVRRLAGQGGRAAWEGDAFWSLRNVSFTLNAGETLGLIGPNGAGKTTLLRLLSGISEPTEGTVRVNGKFAPLIGLGAGFDMERTGRENIFLNAAILGASIQQINGILDEVIDFAELNEFVDRPVKVYSSGMIARLGFSIAFSLLPDIIFLDEVFSVGDIAFQRKSVDRIAQIKARNATLVFISHSLDAVQQFCARTIWLDHGQIRMDGPSAQVVEAYRSATLPARIQPEGR